MGELGRGEQRAAPGAEVLGRGPVAEVRADVLVQCRRAEADRLAGSLEAEQARAVLELEQGLDACRERRIPDRSPDELAVLRPEAEGDLVARDRDVLLAEGRHAVRPRAPG